MKTNFKKIVSLVLTVVMLLGTMTTLIPLAVSAEGAGTAVTVNSDGSVSIPKNQDFTYQGITYRLDVRDGNTYSYAKILPDGSVEFRISYGDMLWFPDINAGDGSAIHMEVTGISREGTTAHMGNVFYGMSYGVKRDSDNGAYTKGNAAVLRTNPRPRLTPFTNANMSSSSGSSSYGSGGSDTKYYNDNGTVLAQNWAFIAASDSSSDNYYKMVKPGKTICYNVAMNDGVVSARWGSLKGDFLTASYTDADYQSKSDYVSYDGAVGFLHVWADSASYSTWRLDALTVTNCQVNGTSYDEYSALNRVTIPANEIFSANGLNLRMDYPTSSHPTSALTINADGTVTVRGNWGDLFWLPNVEVDSQSVIQTSVKVDQIKHEKLSVGTVFNIDAVNGAWASGATAMIAALRTDSRRSLGATGYDKAQGSADYTNATLDGGPGYTLPSDVAFDGTVSLNDLIDTRISQNAGGTVTAEFSVNGEHIVDASYTNASYPFEGSVGFMTHWSGSGSANIGAYVYTIKEYKITNALVDGERRDFDLVEELRAYMMDRVSAYSMQNNLSLDGVIGLNLKVEANYFLTGNETVVVTNANGEAVANAKLSEAVDSYVTISVPVNAKEMNDLYTVSVMNGEDVLKAQTVSVKDYADLLLSMDEYSEWHDLIRAMLNYGAAAQKVLNYRTDALVADVSNLDVDMSSIEAIDVAGDSSMLSGLYVTLTLESDTALNVYFKANSALTVTVDGEAASLTETADGYLLLTISDLAAEQLSQTFEICVNNALTVTISATAWAKNVIDGGYSADMQTLAKALVGYSNAANAMIEAYLREGWTLSAPAYDGGVLATTSYDAGTGLVQDSSTHETAANAERSYMMCVSNTSEEEFLVYEEKLEDCGYVLDSESELESTSTDSKKKISTVSTVSLTNLFTLTTTL